MSFNKGSLAVISASYNQIEVFGITSDNTNLVHISFNGSAWSTWSFVGLNDDLLYKTVPSAISLQPEFFDFFVTDTDDNVKTRHFNGTSWEPDIEWYRMKSHVADAGNPVVDFVSRSKSEYALYTREADGYQITLYNLEGYPGRFVHNTLQEYMKSSPINIITGSKTREIVYIGLDDYMHHFHWANNDYWTIQRVIGDQKFISALTTVTNALGDLQVFGIAPDQTVVHNSYPKSTTAWTGWKQLGTRRFASSISAVVTRGGDQIETVGTWPRWCVVAPQWQWQYLASELGFSWRQLHQCTSACIPRRRYI